MSFSIFASAARRSRSSDTLARGATTAAISPSTSWRARKISNSPNTPGSTLRALAGASRASTCTPEPLRTSTRPSTSSAISASRTDGRDTPNCSARSRSAGRRVPTP